MTALETLYNKLYNSVFDDNNPSIILTVFNPQEFIHPDDSECLVNEHFCVSINKHNKDKFELDFSDDKEKLFITAMHDSDKINLILQNHKHTKVKVSINDSNNTMTERMSYLYEWDKNKLYVTENTTLNKVLENKTTTADNNSGLKLVVCNS